MSRRNRQHRAVFPRVLAVSLALLLGGQAVVSARNGLSDIYARPAIDYLKKKEPDILDLSNDEWLAIEQNVSKAARLMPSNPTYFESLGWLHQIKVTQFASELSIEQMDAHQKAAAESFLHAASIRPTWPYYWGNLAMEHYRRGSYASPEFSKALANAAHFGPWKSANQRLVADLGTETWDYLTPEARREILINLERGLQRQPEIMITIVDYYNKWADVCATMESLGDRPLSRTSQQCAERMESAAELANESGS